MAVASLRSCSPLSTCSELVSKQMSHRDYLCLISFFCLLKNLNSRTHMQQLSFQRSISYSVKTAANISRIPKRVDTIYITGAARFTGLDTLARSTWFPFLIFSIFSPISHFGSLALSFLIIFFVSLSLFYTQQLTSPAQLTFFTVSSVSVLCSEKPNRQRHSLYRLYIKLGWK